MIPSPSFLMRSVILALLALPLAAQPQSEDRSSPAVVLLKTQASGPLLELKVAAFDDLLFAELASRPTLHLVERDELGAALNEIQLQASATSSSAIPIHIGRWTGARIVISSRAVAQGPGLAVAARIIGVETGRVLVADTAMENPDHFAVGAREMADKIAAIIAAKGDLLLPPPVDEAAQIDALRTLLKSHPPPLALLTLPKPEAAAAPPVSNSVVAEEITRLWEAVGGRVSRDETPSPASDFILIRVEARTDSGPRHGSFFSARAHVSLVVIDPPSGRELLRDHQTEIALEASDILARDAAQKKAARSLTFRLLRALPHPARS